MDNTGSAMADVDNYDKISEGISNLLKKNKQQLKTGRNVLFLALYPAYHGYAMDCNFGDEPSIRLTVFTIFELIYIT
jgi:hypothetical protein